MNVELYLTLLASYGTIAVYQTTYKYFRNRKMKNEMDRLFEEIEKTINDIKSDDKPKRTRRTPLRPVNN
jgi:hypothetical protein